MPIYTSDNKTHYNPHNERERAAIDSLVPYFRDRVIRVLYKMTRENLEPYCLWGFRVWGTRYTKHKKAKACDIVSWRDLHSGGNGYAASEHFWQRLAQLYTLNGIFSGSVWVKKYGPLGDKCHGEWRSGKVAKVRLK